MENFLWSFRTEEVREYFSRAIQFHTNKPVDIKNIEPFSCKFLGSSLVSGTYYWFTDLNMQKLPDVGFIKNDANFLQSNKNNFFWGLVSGSLNLSTTPGSDVSSQVSALIDNSTGSLVQSEFIGVEYKLSGTFPTPFLFGLRQPILFQAISAYSTAPAFFTLRGSFVGLKITI